MSKREKGKKHYYNSMKCKPVENAMRQNWKNLFGIKSGNKFLNEGILQITFISSSCMQIVDVVKNENPILLTMCTVWDWGSKKGVSCYHISAACKRGKTFSLYKWAYIHSKSMHFTWMQRVSE